MRPWRLALGALVLASLPLGCDDATSTTGSGGSSSSSTTSGGAGGEGGSVAASVSSVEASSSTGPAPCLDASSCDDQNPCTEDTCGADGRCRSTPAVVDDDDRCTIDACDPLEGPTHVTYVPDDGDACTIDVCTPELGTAFIGERVLLAESFADATGGWTAQPPWAIGPAEPSSTNARGMADPAEDFSAGDDDGIAGVTLGGSPNNNLEGAFYLESPDIDADLEGPVTLEYRRFLGEVPANAPTVEVWDGAGWVVVWETTREVADAPPRGAGWVLMQHDVTAYKNAAMRIRFGVVLGGAQTNPSWNLDDVAVVRRGWSVDADACTIDSCLAASGPRSTQVAINDGDACTTDICHPQAGVAHVPVSCDLGNDGCCPPGCGPIDPDCALPR